MNAMQLAAPEQEVTMTSIELVDFINGLRSGGAVLTHANFLKKVREVLEGGEVKFYSSYLTPQNKEVTMYRFPKREATLMAMSYSAKISAQVYDKMETLENQVRSKTTFQIPQTYATALMLAAEQAVLIENQQKAIAVKETALALAAPKVKFHDAFIRQAYNYTATDVAKKLGISATKLNRWLIEKDALYGTRKHFKQWYMDKGMGVEKFYGHTENGSVYSSIFHTANGMDWIMSNYGAQ